MPRRTPRADIDATIRRHVYAYHYADIADFPAIFAMLMLMMFRHMLILLLAATRHCADMLLYAATPPYRAATLFHAAYYC